MINSSKSHTRVWLIQIICRPLYPGTRSQNGPLCFHNRNRKVSISAVIFSKNRKISIVAEWIIILRILTWAVVSLNETQQLTVIFNRWPLPTYLPTYIHTYLHTYLPTYLHTYLRTYLPTYLPTYLQLSAKFDRTFHEWTNERILAIYQKIVKWK